MTNRDIRSAASAYLCGRLRGKVSSAKIVSGLEEQGYTVVYYNGVSDTGDVKQLAELLGVGEHMRSLKGFTYADSGSRIVFLNEELSEEERCYVLLHEQAHILLGHLKSGAVIGQDVIQESEANEFVHYVLYPDFTARLRLHRRQIGWITAALAALICIFLLICAMPDTAGKAGVGDYYVTSTGNKYHEKDCIFVKDKTNVRRISPEEISEKGYEPCEICLP